MKRFNLSGWAVSHPTLVLFLMIALGVAGFISYQKLGRAEDPFFTVKVVNVSAIWPGATAQEMQTQVADPIEKKLQELPYFEKVQTYSKPSFTALQVTFKDFDPAEGRAVSVLSLAQEAGRRAGPVALRPARPQRQRRILRRRLHPLHDDRRGRRLQAVEEDGRRHAPAAAQGDGGDQGQPLRRPGRAHLRRILARQTRHPRHHAAGAVRFARQAEQRHARRHGGNLLAARAAARHRRARRRQGRRRNPGREQRPRVPSRRYRHRHAWFCRSARPSWRARKASPPSASASSPPRAPTSWSSARRSPTRPPNS